MDPAISPDGRWITFARPTSKLVAIWVAPIDNPSAAKMLTTDQDGLNQHRHPTFSPDGKEIAYHDWDSVWIVPVAGGRPRRVIAQGRSSGPVWSTTGNIIFAGSDRDKSSALWRISVAGGGAPLRLTMGTGPELQPHVSRDGARLVYSTYATSQRLVLLNRKNKVRSEVRANENEEDVAISPDGARLAYVSVRSDGPELWIQDLQDLRRAGQPRRIPFLARPNFSPDGRWIAGHLAIQGNRDIWIAPTSGGLPQRFVGGERSTEVQPVWSPDGSTIAYASDRGGTSQIWLAPVAAGRLAGEPRPLTRGEAAKFLPAWAPDGSRLAFIAAGKQGQSEVWIVDLPGGESRRVYGAVDATMVQWGSTLDELLVSAVWDGDRFRDLRRVSISTGDVEAIGPDTQFGNTGRGAFAASAAGQIIVQLVEEARGDIWLLEAAPGTY
jgi:Tol biopolymer transport system component